MRPSRSMRDLMLGFVRDLSAGDPAFVELVSAAEGATWIGTDPGEYWTDGPAIRAVLRKQVEEMPTFAWRTLELAAHEEGTVGWASGTFEIDFADAASGVRMRLTMVCHREDEGWAIVQSHASIGASNVDYVGRELTTAIDEVADLVERERPDLTPAASAEGTVTIVFTDLESSTAHNEAAGDDVWVPLMLKHAEIIRRCASAAGGSVVKDQGDGCMLAFPSARRAVDACASMQREVTSLDARLRVRMGMHTGEPVRHASDFFGRDVALAARLGSAALGGEILVSDLVRSLVEPSGSVAFEATRELDLKGFDGPQRAHVVRWD